jgi:Tol biopolymer transport system component
MKKKIGLIIVILNVWITIPGFSFQEEPLPADSTKRDLPLEEGRTFSFDLTEGSWISLDVSPDGQQIVFDFLGDLYTLPIGGGDATRITRGFSFDSQPRFSPDGREIVYISDESGGENVWVYELDSQEKRQITKGNDYPYQSPDWSPDGEYLIASKQSGGNLHKIWLYHKDGGGGTALVNEPDNKRMLEGVFGPEGRFIWFSERTGSWNYNAALPQYQIAKYDREEGDIIPQVSRYGSSFRPTLSGDGKWLAYGTRHDDETGFIIRVVY